MLFIDGDILVYKYAITAQRLVKLPSSMYPGEVWTKYAQTDEALAGLNGAIQRLLDTTEQGEYKVALSDPSSEANWRYQIQDDYKAHRGMVERPILYWRLRQVLEDDHGAIWRPTLEGDDLLGIWATEEADADVERIVASIDKDMLTVPGRHYNWDRDAFKTVHRAEAIVYHLGQTLTGDATDGYPGCKGTGPVAARKILRPLVDGEATYAEAWAAIERAFEKAAIKAGKDAEAGRAEALLNARVAHILHAEDYDMATNTVRLWTPPTEDE